MRKDDKTTQMELWKGKIKDELQFAEPQDGKKRAVKHSNKIEANIYLIPVTLTRLQMATKRALQSSTTDTKIPISQY